MAKELYVGHISEQATEEDLRKLFSLMGPVTSVHLIVDQDTGEFKRCGYVRMLSEVNLEEVVETLDGTYLIDRCIVVSIAKPQKDRPPKTAGMRRKPGGGARPAAAKDAPRNERPAGAGSGARSGRPAAATDSAKTRRPSATKDSVKSERPVSTNRAPKSGNTSTTRKTGGSSRPPSKGRR